METAQMKNQITEGVIWKQLLMFFFPIMIGTFFQQLYNTIDTVVVGQFVGTKALASVGGSSSQMINLVVGFFTGLSSGASVTPPSTTERKMRSLCERGFTMPTLSPRQAASF